MDIVTLAMAKKYTDDTLTGTGALKGEKGDPGPQGPAGADGQDGVDGAPGADGFSPTITENASNSQTSYKLDITDVNGTITTPNLQAVSFVENADVYSTEETVVGQWIDGKPIYQRVYITSATLTSDVETVLVSGIENIDVVVALRVELSPTINLGIHTPIPNMSSYVQLVNTNIVAKYTSTSATWIVNYIVMKYTKTTDTATIAIPTAAEMTAAYWEGVQSA